MQNNSITTDTAPAVHKIQSSNDIYCT